eukprot:15341761-Ditylum_brightwellii.AAC.1
MEATHPSWVKDGVLVTDDIQRFSLDQLGTRVLAYDNLRTGELGRPLEAILRDLLLLPMSASETRIGDNCGGGVGGSCGDSDYMGLRWGALN